jgi:hypothetical protein
MIEWSDEIPLGRKRAVLAAVTNDRPAEWLYAYAPPDDMGKPIAIRQVEDSATCLPLGGPFTFPLQDAQPLAFEYDGGTIYTNVETATLIYTRSFIDASELSALMQRAFVLELAVRLASPLGKWDANKIAAKAKQAEIARDRAIADEENKNRRTDRRYVSDAEYARAGIGV